MTQPTSTPAPAGRMAGKSALITGGGAGIGAATATLFCSEGAAVTLVDANAQALERTEQAIRAQLRGARVLCLVADIADEPAAHEAVRQASQAHGGLHVLVNNAAMRNYSALADATPAEWQAIVAVNLTGTATWCRAALPLLRQSGRGAIVNVSSCYAVTGRKGMGLYDATKAAQLALTRTLACEEAAHGVRANAVCPGGTLTDFHVGRAQAAGKTAEDLRAERRDHNLIGRWAEPVEIAWPIVWLASDESSFITGQALVIDGGLSIM